MKTVVAIIALAVLSSAAGAGDKPAKPSRLAERQQRDLAKALDGKVPGKPETCVRIGLGSGDGLKAVTDSVLLYRVNKDLVYRNDLNGRCTGVSTGSTLVLQPTNSQYCRGDIAFGMDLTIGMRGASCALGDFVPYRTPK